MDAASIKTERKIRSRDWVVYIEFGLRVLAGLFLIWDGIQIISHNTDP